jgi:ribonucleoside-diphosphate reductase alpha chain
MQVRKRNNSFEPVELSKIEASLKRYCGDLPNVDVYRIAAKTVGGLVEGVSTLELDLLSVSTAKDLIIDDPVYAKVAARILANVIQKEIAALDVHSFSQCIELGFSEGLISAQTHALVMTNKRKLNAAIKHERDWNMEFHGLQTVYDRYLLKHPTQLRPAGGGKKERSVIETPQYFFLRVACGLANDANEAIEFYNLLSSLEYMTSTPTLFNSGTTHSQMSSCYLLNSSLDSLESIYKQYGDIAMLSKFAGGIGVSMSGVRGRGALIKGTNGKSNGIVPWAHTLSASVAGVNQGGKRKGAAAVYLETHHPDIMQFLELKDNTGEREQRAYNLNLANWVSDLFMRRVKEDDIWSLFDPTVAPELNDLYGEEYEKRYLELESDVKYCEQIPARKLYARMMRTLAETGNAWMCFKDTCNRRGNQVNDEAKTMIHLSNLCTEVIEATSSGQESIITREQMATLSKQDLIRKNIRITGYDIEKDGFAAIIGAETAVCNLGSINMGRGYIKNGKLDKEKLRKNVATAVRYLDRVIDRNFYPTAEAHASNDRWRPVGLGMMGIGDFFMQMRIPFDSEQAIRMSAEIQEEVYYQALKTSCELAKKLGKHRDFLLTRAAKGDLQFDLAGVEPSDAARWADLKAQIKDHGLRNSLLIAIAPTATISHICGVEEGIEPVKSNLLKRETLSGEFIAVNRYLVEDLRKIGRWNAETINQLKVSEGSLSSVPNLPAEMYEIYKTVWEMSMKSLIAHAAARGAYIDQSHSLNMFIDLNKYPKDKRIGVLSSLYMHAWEMGLKTTYYLRSRAATRIEQTTTARASETDQATAMAPEEAEVCESCQ